MNKQFKKGLALANKIDATYNKLDNYNEYFFDAYQDDLRVQRDCAFMELDELEEYCKNPKKQFGDITGTEGVEICIKNLEDTLTYCNAVIKLQNLSKELPKSIYG